MADTQIDTAELRLLANIIALVMDDQPGQSAAALEALRRRAAASGVTGGALKNLFERLATEQAAAARRAVHTEAQRLQLELDAAAMQATRLSAENAELYQRLHMAHRLVRQYEDRERTRRRPEAWHLRFAAPHRSRHLAGLAAGAVLALLAGCLVGDQWDRAAGRHPPRQWVAPAVQPRGQTAADPVRLLRPLDPHF